MKYGKYFSIQNVVNDWILFFWNEIFIAYKQKKFIVWFYFFDVDIFC